MSSELEVLRAELKRSTERSKSIPPYLKGIHDAPFQFLKLRTQNSELRPFL